MKTLKIVIALAPFLAGLSHADHIRRIDVGGRALSVSVVGEHAFVAVGQSGLVVVMEWADKQAETPVVS